MTNESEIKNANGFETTVNATASPLAAGDPLTIDYPFNNLLALHVQIKLLNPKTSYRRLYN